jgi:hypothetical protein
MRWDGQQGNSLKAVGRKKEQCRKAKAKARQNPVKRARIKEQYRKSMAKVARDPVKKAIYKEQHSKRYFKKNGTKPGDKQPTKKKFMRFLRKTFGTVEDEILLPGPERYMDYRILVNIFIETDGRQHFEVVKAWKKCPPPVEQFVNDCQKIKRAFGMKHHVIRLKTEDIRKNRYDWHGYVCSAVKRLQKEDEPRLVVPFQDCYKNMGGWFEENLIVLPIFRV